MKKEYKILDKNVKVIHVDSTGLEKWFYKKWKYSNGPRSTVTVSNDLIRGLINLDNPGFGLTLMMYFNFSRGMFVVRNYYMENNNKCWKDIDCKTYKEALWVYSNIMLSRNNITEVRNPNYKM